MKKFRRKVLDMLMSNNSGSSLRQQLFDSAPFCSELLYTAIPQRAASGTTATFTRATTSTWPNNDGYLVTGVAGEIGFVGARRVRNLIRSDYSSEIMARNNLTAFPVAITQNDATPPAGYSRADRQTSTTPASRSGAFTGSTTTIAAGSTVFIRCVAKAGSGRYLCFGDQSDSNWHVMTLDTQTGSVVAGGTTVSTTAEDLGDGWWELVLKFTKDITGVVGALCCHSDTASNAAYPFIGAGEYWWATGFHIEDVTAQTTQTAGEYVSVGVESAPYYHGSMVDGVKCFPTDISGNPIPSTTMLGYQAQGARTNLCLQSNAFTTTWTNSPALSTLSQNVIGPDGAVSAWTCADTDAANTSRLYQSITLTAAAYTASLFVKKTSGATSFPVIALVTGTVYGFATLDTNSGVATAWTSNGYGTTLVGVSARCTSFNADFWRFELTATATAAAYTYQLYPAGTTNATQSTGVIDAAVTGSAVFYGAQVELGSFASSYIATTTAAATRDADVLTYPSAGNVSKSLGWFSCEASCGNTGASAQGDLLTDSGTFALYTRNDQGGVLRFYNGIDDVNISSASSLTTPYSAKKIAATWNNPVSASGSVDGATAVTAVLTGAGPAMGANLRIGGGVGTALNGNIKNVRIGQRQLSASEMQAITS